MITMKLVEVSPAVCGRSKRLRLSLNNHVPAGTTIVVPVPPAVRQVSASLTPAGDSNPIQHPRVVASRVGRTSPQTTGSGRREIDDVAGGPDIFKIINPSLRQLLPWCKRNHSTRTTHFER